MSDWETIEGQGLLVPKEVKQSIATPIERQLMESIQHLENEFNDWKKSTLSTSDLYKFDDKTREYVTNAVNGATKLLEELINAQIERMATELKEILAQELCEIIDEMMEE